MGITHAKVSALSDGSDSTLVRPSDWNAAHVGGSRVVDLGVILASACTGGNSTDLEPLIGASVGDVVQLVVANTDFVQHDSDAAIDVTLAGMGEKVVAWAAANVLPLNVYYNYSIPPYVEDGQPLLLVGVGSLATAGAIHLKAVVTEA